MREAVSIAQQLATLPKEAIVGEPGAGVDGDLQHRPVERFLYVGAQDECQELACVGLVAGARGDVNGVHRRILVPADGAVDDRERREIHSLKQVWREIRDDVVANQHHCRLPVVEKRLAFLPARRRMVTAEAAAIHELPPAREHAAHAWIGIRDAALHQLRVECQTVLPQVEVIEPRGRGPEVPCADRERLHVPRLEAFARVDEIGPRARRLGQAGRGQHVAAQVKPDLVMLVRNPVLPAVERDEIERRAMHRRARLRREQVAHVVEQPRRGELAHPMAGEPEHDIRRRAGQPVSDDLLVALVIVDVELDPDVGMLAFEVPHRGPPRGKRRGIGGVGIDDERTGTLRGDNAEQDREPDQQAREPSHNPRGARLRGKRPVAPASLIQRLPSRHSTTPVRSNDT